MENEETKSNRTRPSPRRLEMNHVTHVHVLVPKEVHHATVALVASPVIPTVVTTRVPHDGLR